MSAPAEIKSANWFQGMINTVEMVPMDGGGLTLSLSLFLSISAPANQARVAKVPWRCDLHAEGFAWTWCFSLPRCYEIHVYGISCARPTITWCFATGSDFRVISARQSGAVKFRREVALNIDLKVSLIRVVGGLVLSRS